tara:strand:- start:80231 stop:81373 length:1143 start_codon:yes stop_codon:yes gene_type:complete
MGGAEWSLLDIVTERRKSFDDRVVLFEDGDFADRLRDQSIDVRICSLLGPSRSVKRESGWWRQLGSMTSVWRQASDLAEAAVDMDILYANTMKAFVVSAVASRRTGIPLIFHLRDILSPAHFSRINRRIVQAICRFVNVTVIANSEATAAEFRRLVGDKVDTQVVYNGISSEPFDRAVANSATLATKLRQSLGIDHGVKVIGVFGRLARWKGQHVAIEAMVDRPDWHLLIVGKALFGEDEYADQLRRLVKKKRIEHRIHFLGFRSDIPEVMQGCDLVLHTSIDPEPFGRVIAEAMLASRPVVAANAGGVTEIIDHGSTGWLAPPGDANATRDASEIAILKSDSSMISRARDFARSQFDLFDRAEELSRVIDRVSTISGKS